MANYEDPKKAVKVDPGKDSPKKQSKPEAHVDGPSEAAKPSPDYTYNPANEGTGLQQDIDHYKRLDEEGKKQLKKQDAAKSAKKTGDTKNEP